MTVTTPTERPASTPEAQRSRAIQRTTWTAICTNATLAVSQVIVGLFANAFSLVADAAHTTADLITDFMVLIAGKRGAEPPDAEHPYGHGRIETAVTLFLGASLFAVGIGFLLAAGNRLQNMDSAAPVHQVALYMAIATLMVKEILFRFMRAAARRWRAAVLEANAWHARSDAASSLVVAVGIAGSLAGYPFLEPLGAAVVGFLILSMGIRLGWRALRELIDTGLPHDDVARIRATICSTPGVRDTHDLRTRRMADRVLCDAHVLVNPRSSVSEGHRVSDAVYAAIREQHPEVRDILVHIDVEDDREARLASFRQLPDRSQATQVVLQLLGRPDLPAPRLQLHYLGGKVEIEVLLDHAFAAKLDQKALSDRIKEVLLRHPEYRAITFFVQNAP